ncbi:TOBE domain-containing protein [Halobellus limi]|jgi:molybdate transport system regulatory protein|uniref:LysR family transcriptional regulator n=1 Tax=Halobellus limi TaxID=699433 RepID=A0A1H5T3A6_9EURY|nr:TOBE domain-containing protein [Halobellus limi]QCC47418.1 LysR family transcriptional regulator [Halobellus limi]SEF57249.1 molybdate transport system regulatory protein [Halobellus limi]
METSSSFDAYISSDGVTLDARDVALLRAIDREGSLNTAAESLGRSYAHAQRRVVELEAAFGSLVERTRGGSGGGGSTLTETARDLLAAFERTRASFEGVAEIAETVIVGTVTERDGELVTVETSAGNVRALVPEGDDEVQLSLRADAVTLTDPDDTPVPEHTSARNRFSGTVVGVESGDRIARVAVDIGLDQPVLALVTEDSRKKLALDAGNEVVVSFKATATRGVPL